MRVELSIGTGVGEQSIEAALAASRHAVLFELLTLFATKSRSKTAPQLVQRAHSLSHLAAATVVVGPHSLPARLFVADWAPTSAPTPTPPPTPTPAVVQPPPAAITPALILRLNAASAADPVLASLLRKAASGGASNIELGGLARYIEGLRREEELQNPTRPVPAPAPTPVVPPLASGSAVPDVPDEPPPPSIVLEFRESATERFILPNHAVFTLLPVDYPNAAPVTAGVTAPAHPNARRRSVLLSFFVFGPAGGKGKAKEGTGDTQGPPTPVDMVIEDCTEAVRNALWKASRSSRPRDNDLEDWYKRQILAVPPRELIVARERAPTPPPEPVAPALSRASSSQIFDTYPLGRRGAAAKRGMTVLGSEGSGSDAPARRPPAKRSRKSSAASKRAAGKAVEASPAPPPRIGARPVRSRVATAKAQEAALGEGDDSSDNDG